MAVAEAAGAVALPATEGAASLHMPWGAPGRHPQDCPGTGSFRVQAPWQAVGATLTPRGATRGGRSSRTLQKGSQEGRRGRQDQDRLLPQGVSGWACPLPEDTSRQACCLEQQEER